MTIDPIAGGAPPRVVVPAVRTAARQTTDRTATGEPHQLPAAQLPHTVQLSFHQDLKVLMTRVLEATTGDVVAEYPARKVLDTVAQLMRAARAREGL